MTAILARKLFVPEMRAVVSAIIIANAGAGIDYAVISPCGGKRKYITKHPNAACFVIHKRDCGEVV